MALQLGPVPQTDDSDHKKQNNALQTLFRAFTSTLQTLAADVIPLSPASGGTGLTTYGPILAQNVSKTASYTVVNADKTKSIVLSGGGTAAIKTITLNAVGGYDADFQVRIVNNDTRGWAVAPSGGTTFILWPGQVCTAMTNGSGWSIDPSNLGVRYKPNANTTFNVDPVNGNDSNDGLATGAAAFKTIQKAIDNLHTNFDTTNTLTTIQLADGTYNGGDGLGASINIAYAMASFEFQIFGNAITPTNVVVKASTGNIIFNVEEPATVSIEHMKLDGSNGSNVGIQARQFATVDFGDLTFASFTSGTCIQATNHASMGMVGNCTITGNFSVFFSLVDQSFISATSFTITVPAVTCTDFIVQTDLSSLTLGCTITNAGLTGKQWSLAYGSFLFRGGSTVPGTVAGTPVAGALDTTGCYVV